MFPVRGLLAHVACPDESGIGKRCARPACPFDHKVETSERASSTTGSELAASSSTSSNHTAASSPKTSIRTNAGATLKRARADESDISSTTSRDESASKKTAVQSQYRSPLDSFSPGPRNAYAAAKLGKSIPRPAASRSATDALHTKPTSRDPDQNSEADLKYTASSSGARLVDPILSAPQIARGSHSSVSQVPLSVRQASLRTYFATFTTLYAPLVPPYERASSSQHVHQLLKRVAHQLAAEDALASEQDIYQTSNTKTMTYRNSVRTSLVGIMRRQREDREAQEQGRLRETVGALGIDAAYKAKEMQGKAGDGAGDGICEQPLLDFLRTSHLVGPPKVYTSKAQHREEQEKGALDIAGLEAAGLVASQDLLARVQYPLPAPGSPHGSEGGNEDATNEAITQAWGAGSSCHDLVGETRNCERCKTDFCVQPVSSDEAAREACCYHWGKRRHVREGGGTRGPRLPRWSCCDALDEATTFASSSLSQIAVSSGVVSSGEGRAFAEAAGARSTGCARGPHVFKDEEAKSLHEREAFVSSIDLCRALQEKEGDRTTYEVLALDCELVNTTAGMSVARLTVLDQAAKVVLDRYIRPRASIVDYNTRFSGIRADNIPTQRDTAHSLEGVREALGRLMTPSTILIGHGLENDLKAMRLVHTRVVDSALLYPHPKGLPYRLSLRELSEKFLGRFIQQQGDIAGHDPEEDARAALDLIRLRFREVAEKTPKERGAAKDPAETGKVVTPRHNEAAGSSSSGQVTSSSSDRSAAAGRAILPVPRKPPAPSAKATASLFMPKRRLAP